MGVPAGAEPSESKDDKPELLVLGAFAGGLLLAQILKHFGGEA